jgi:hypothetical protein
LARGDRNWPLNEAQRLNLRRHACSPEHALQPWRGKPAGVAKRPRHLPPENPFQADSQLFTLAVGLVLTVERWQEWVDVQMALAGVEKRANVYITLGLDGSVVSSGVGLPRWAATCQELEPLDSTRTKITQV